MPLLDILTNNPIGTMLSSVAALFVFHPLVSYMHRYLPAHRSLTLHHGSISAKVFIGLWVLSAGYFIFQTDLFLSFELFFIAALAISFLSLMDEIRPITNESNLLLNLLVASLFLFGSNSRLLLPSSFSSFPEWISFSLSCVFFLLILMAFRNIGKFKGLLELITLTLGLCLSMIFYFHNALDQAMLSLALVILSIPGVLKILKIGEVYSYTGLRGLVSPTLIAFWLSWQVIELQNILHSANTGDFSPFFFFFIVLVPILDAVAIALISVFRSKNAETLSFTELIDRRYTRNKQINIIYFDIYLIVLCVGFFFEIIGASAATYVTTLIVMTVYFFIFRQYLANREQSIFEKLVYNNS